MKITVKNYYFARIIAELIGCLFKDIKKVEKKNFFLD